MEIDKTIGGKWCDDSTELDDIAYYLYIKNRINTQPNLKPCPQDFLIEFIKRDFMVYKKYYTKAYLIIRKNKVNKLLKNIKNDNR